MFTKNDKGTNSKFCSVTLDLKIQGVLGKCDTLLIIGFIFSFLQYEA